MNTTNSVCFAHTFVLDCAFCPDAVLGLKELLVKHPSLAVLSLRDLIEKTFPLANDEDRSVRRTVSTFVEALLPLCPRGAMEPFLPLVVTYVSQSLTHLDEKVRMDTLPVVNALVGYLGCLLYTSPSPRDS